jgi:hypothetical protein
MKVALMCGGQPRFTQSFIILQQQLQGFDVADMYMCLWSTPAASTSDTARQQLEPLILPNYTLKQVKVMEQHPWTLPPHRLQHDFDAVESSAWWYKRRHGMWSSTKEVFDMILDEYDMIIKFRPEGRLDRAIDVNTIDLSNDMVFPSNHRNGLDSMKICDQFLFANRNGMEFYADVINHFNDYIMEVYPDWENDAHEWASEHLLGHHLLVNKKTQTVGDYQHLLRVDGISPFDDKHWRG